MGNWRSATTVAVLLFPCLAWGACNVPNGAPGQIFFNTAYKVLEYCNGTTWINLGNPNVTGALNNCTSPVGVPGQIFFNTAYKVLEYCNGTTWINLGTPNATGALNNCTLPAGTPGKMQFNTSGNTLQYCNGTTWVNAGYWQLDTDPDPFNFIDLTGQALNTQVESNIIQIIGLGGFTPVAVSGSGSPQLRTCNDAACSSVITTWATGMNIANNKYLQARLTTAGTNSTAQISSITIGTLGNSVWTVTTLDDTTPNAYNFTNLVDQSKSAQVTSNIIQITGINVAVTAAASGASSQVRSCIDITCSSVLSTWGSSISISNNQYLQVRQTTSASADTITTATVTVGTGTSDWTATTVAVTPGSQNYGTPGTYSFVVPNYNTLTVTAVKGGTGGTGASIQDIDSFPYAEGSVTCNVVGVIPGSPGSPGGNSTFAASPAVTNATKVYSIGDSGAPIPGQTITITVGAGGAGGAGGVDPNYEWPCSFPQGATGATGSPGSVNTVWN